jgi:hypothetical protein
VAAHPVPVPDPSHTDMTDSRRTNRLQILASLGVTGRVADEILAADSLPYDRGVAAEVTLPLDDEPLVDAWRGYVDEARSGGVFDTLKRHLVQLRFPVRAGMSDDDAYRLATRRGDVGAADAFGDGLTLRRPDALALTVPTTMAGGVPLLVAGDRADFVLLVQALTGRNEPVDVPEAMGACLVKGLNNWSRVAAYRAAWTARTGESDDGAWAAEFQQLIPQKALYQDRLIILSRGPYSATPATAAGLSEGEWLGQSLAIRREHELTHYFTYRVFGSMRTHVVDELVADFVGLVRGFGGYRAELALRFLGLEAFPAYRTGGRLEHYRGTWSDEAFAAVQALAVRAARNLETLAATALPSSDDLNGLGQLTLGLVTLTIEELASDQLPSLLSSTS